MPEALNRTKATRRRSSSPLWHNLIRVCHGIGDRSISVYAQGKVWVAERQTGKAILQAGQRMVASLHAMSRQALGLQYKGLLGAVVAIIILVAMWKVPQWQATSWKGQIDLKDVAKLENDARTTLVQGFGAVALIITLLFTWRQIRATEKNLQITQETATKNLALAQDGQITERFTRAVEQLGSGQMEVRLGGIYALERIARDSARDHWPIMEILTAYLQTHARWIAESRYQPTPPRGADEEGPRSVQNILNELDKRRRIGEQEGPRTDIQAILTVLGRRIWTRETDDQRLDLSELDLRGARLLDANLEHAVLVRTHLEEATLKDVHLERANLREAHLEGAQLIGVHCERANLAASWFEGVPPNIDVGSFAGVYMQGANLSNAHLMGVELSAVYGLTQMQIATACTNEMTVLPDYLDVDTPTC